MMRLVAVVIVLALAGVLTPVGHPVTGYATAQRKSSSHNHGHGHDPAKQEPKKDDLPRKSGDKKEALRHVPQRRAVQQQLAAESWTRVVPPPPSTGSAVLDDASHVEHLLVLTRPAVLQVFRN